MLAVGTFVFAVQTDTGTTRLQMAFADALVSVVQLTVPATTSPSGPSPAAFATLEAKLDRLNADRSRLKAGRDGAGDSTRCPGEAAPLPHARPAAHPPAEYGVELGTAPGRFAHALAEGESELRSD